MSQKGADIMLNVKSLALLPHTVNGKLTKASKRLIKEVYLDACPYKEDDGAMFNLIEGIHGVSVDDESFTKFFFEDFGDLSDENIDEVVESMRLGYPYPTPGSVYTSHLRWMRNPKMGAGVVSIIHEVRYDI